MTGRAGSPPAAPERSVLGTVSDLLAAVGQLPPAERAAARARVDAALDGDARRCRAALGMLALDIAAGASPCSTAGELTVHVHLVDLPDTAAAPARLPAPATV